MESIGDIEWARRAVQSVVWRCALNVAHELEAIAQRLRGLAR